MGCSKCYGSGEGMYDGSRGCTACKGTGEAWNRGEIEEEFEVEWQAEDLNDLEIVDGYDQCEYCETDMLEIVKEELKWELEQIL